ncbi:zinc carboxypeptidase [Roseimicrobium gellanilyticum]|uniref:Zinc carboxypeptidase n=1 Tax=Roseimicrobium gellanilyticum TaxID=748857 RepID=A0A366HM72_9BACT|nr:M14 family zinc carboxypeptidase [Roseimicrobium gellanilyticum]RBP44237.1 zinc carboxypeptidase [Roseimicrobium gellanilyticum]
MNPFPPSSLHFLVVVFVFAMGWLTHPMQALTVESDFEGASVRVMHVDAGSQTVQFMPGGDPKRGWPCWWCFRVEGLDPRKPLTLQLHASDLPMPQANGVPSNKPLSADWAMPLRASFSPDGKSWKKTPLGVRAEAVMTYTFPVEGTSVLVAWGPPFTPSSAAELVRRVADSSAAAEERELCKSREGRTVPMLRVCEGDRVEARRFGIWVQARQHAWESGASWVCQGFTEWLMSDESNALWLRQHAEIYIVPIMDIDNTATGNGGKEALPQDHNRDWTEKPNWNEVAAAQTHIREFVKEGRMDVFLDLHNPGAKDTKAFFYALPDELVKEPMLGNRKRLFSLSRSEVGSVMPMMDGPKYDGPKYHPLWRQMSGTWVTMNGNPHTVAVCLETPWNIEQSTVEGYKAVGAKLGVAVQRYLEEGPKKE